MHLSLFRGICVEKLSLDFWKWVFFVVVFKLLRAQVWWPGITWMSGLQAAERSQAGQMLAVTKPGSEDWLFAYIGHWACNSVNCASSRRMAVCALASVTDCLLQERPSGCCPPPPPPASLSRGVQEGTMRPLAGEGAGVPFPTLSCYVMGSVHTPCSEPGLSCSFPFLWQSLCQV